MIPTNQPALHAFNTVLTDYGSWVFGHELAPAAFQREGWLEIVPAFLSREGELSHMRVESLHATSSFSGLTVHRLCWNWQWIFFLRRNKKFWCTYELLMTPVWIYKAASVGSQSGCANRVRTPSITQATCGSKLGFAATEAGEINGKQCPQGSIPSYTIFLCLTISGFSKSVTDASRFYHFALVYMHLYFYVKFQ